MMADLVPIPTPPAMAPELMLMVQLRASTKDCAAAILFAAEKATSLALDAIQVRMGTCIFNAFPLQASGCVS